ncbi:MAG: glycosyltransferase [Bdellovibrionales bacterium]|nr:glycosyltransferase [Bdellovibrionales bacterium]
MAKISVIIPTYNRLATLPRAVSSVLDQSFRDLDIWIVDDGSTDGTADWVQNELLQNQQDIACHYLRSQNKGVSHARNLALKASAGEWVAFLDSDDEWLPNKLADQIRLLEAQPGLRLIHGEEIWIRNGVRVNPMKKHQKSGGRIFDRCVELCCISPSTTLVHRSLFSEIGYFREDFPVCEDYDMWLRICEKYEVGFVETPLIKKYGGHEDQLSQKYVAMDYYRVKSLSQFVDSKLLSKEEKSLLLDTLSKKCEILLRGFRRHNNMDQFHEVEEIARQSLRPSTSL